MLFKDGNRIRLVRLDTDHHPFGTEHILQQGDPLQNALWLFKHHTVIGSQVRFTLDPVENQGMNLLFRRRRHFDVRRESSATHADHTGQAYLFNHFIGRKIIRIGRLQFCRPAIFTIRS